MGNRGTTPSWDEEEIAKYGLAAHWSFINRSHDARRKREVRRQLLDVLQQILKTKQEQNK